MTIVKHTRCFDGYKLSAIPEDLLARLRATPSWRKNLSVAVTRLQAFCELTGKTLVGLSYPSTRALLEEFAAAFYSCLFNDPNERGDPWLRLRLLRLELPRELDFYFPCTSNQKSWRPSFRQLVNEYDRREFDPVLVEFWKGWAAPNAVGVIAEFRLHRFWKRFGPDRTRELMSAARTWLSTRRSEKPTPIEAFAEHAARVGNVDFNDSASISVLVDDFMQKFLPAAHARGVQVGTLLPAWRAFVGFLDSYLLGKFWASPLYALPLPQIGQVPGAKTNLKKTPEGHEVKVALITPVPLHLTDSQAKELLFRDIRREADAILAWARYEVREARKRFEQRATLAKRGVVNTVGHTRYMSTGRTYRVSRDCPEHLEHAAATFEASGLAYLNTGRVAQMIFPTPLAQTAWDLGLPTPALLLAHGAILVRKHPKITSGFLDELELFDADGRQTGLVRTDAGYYLRSTKRRKGKKHAEQDVLLTPETLEVVRDVIALTKPLRAWLREKKSKHWRKLFLATQSMGSPPTAWDSPHEASRRSDWLAQRFSRFAAQADAASGDFSWLKDHDKAIDLAKRFSLKRLRSSAAVLVYLETGSVQQMATALGHETWRPTLLDRYLPKPIQEFFTERWIRLFQTGIVCETLRDSPYLLEASHFATMADLDDFLEHHALRRIPKHLESPDKIGGERREPPSSRVVFGIEVGILTILMSLEAAVRKATQDPCGRAIRWARISEKLVPHLESQAEQPEFKAMVLKARTHVNPRLVEALIYG